MPHLHPRKHIEVQGVVQGVGSRPFVYRIARLAGVHGHVLNASKGVDIEAEGGGVGNRVQQDLPPLARIEQPTISEMEPRGEDTFVIHESARRRATRLSATCDPANDDGSQIRDALPPSSIIPGHSRPPDCSRC
jgi:hydrogenase maturation factor HypF (carbamoyltransferase family)